MISLLISLHHTLSHCWKHFRKVRFTNLLTRWGWRVVHPHVCTQCDPRWKWIYWIVLLYFWSFIHSFVERIYFEFNKSVRSHRYYFWWFFRIKSLPKRWLQSGGSWAAGSLGACSISSGGRPHSQVFFSSYIAPMTIFLKLSSYVYHVICSHPQQYWFFPSSNVFTFGVFLLGNDTFVVFRMLKFLGAVVLSMYPCKVVTYVMTHPCCDSDNHWPVDDDTQRCCRFFKCVDFISSYFYYRKKIKSANMEQFSQIFPPSFENNLK